MNARRFFTAAGVVAVASVAGAISYRHQQHLAVTHGQPHALSLVWPLCVDGLVTVTAIAISTDRAGGFRPRLWALWGFWIGVAVSVATNWLATAGGLTAHAVSAFPALAFLLAVESLSSKPRTRKRAVVTEPAAPADVREAPKSAPETTPVTDRATVTRPARKTPPSVTAAAKVASAARRLPDGTAAQIAAKADVSESTARRHLAAMKRAAGASPSGPAPAQINGHDLLAELAEVNA